MLAAYTYIILVFNHVIMAFHGTSVPHKCTLDTSVYQDNSTTTQNPGHKQLNNVSFSRCSATHTYSDGQNETVQCSYGQWTYYPVYGETNIVSQFDLVCERKYLASLANTIYFVGVMVGGLLFGDLADRFGRLPIMLFTLYSSVILGIVTAFSVTYTMFVTLRFVTGILMQGLQTSAYTLIMELYIAKYRPFAGAVTECFFGVAIMILAGAAYLVRDWRYLQIVVTLPGLLTLFYPWVVPESLRWLIIKGKLNKAEEVIHRICKVNKIPFPADRWEKLKQSCDKGVDSLQPRQHSLIDLFRTSHIRQSSVILFYIWFAISASYYGLTFQLTSFSGSRYLIFFIGGAVETLAYILTLPVMKRFGRKKPLLACFVAAAALCLGAGIVSDYTTGWFNVTVALALAGRCAVAGLFGIIFVYTSEVYPTVIRNIGMGACCLWARAGGVAAPQINQWTKVLWSVDATIIFGVMAVVAGIFLFPLPETHNRRLPDSVQEVEDISRDEEAAGANGHLASSGKVSIVEEQAGLLPSSDQIKFTDVSKEREL
ncbi:unnamed protein product [Candidula unifasciata]|uniref:Major facilitator superfamily (MFS) profile domain-containing protein n=1 Tax=Candidula unifasciata TaxID=100452 RepID=A0A8S3ZG48_9EUPU|nr:unnamed protein product [Candidula unifasciata]